MFGFSSCKARSILLEEIKQNEREKKKKGPFLTSSIPNLGFDDFIIHIQAPSRELDSDGWFGLEAKLVLGESWKQIGLPNTRITDQNNLEKVIVFIICFVTRHWEKRERERSKCFLRFFQKLKSPNEIYARILFSRSFRLLPKEKERETRNWKISSGER